MGAIPADIETDTQPPMTVPLWHFVVALGFLLAGVVLGALAPLGVAPGRATLAHVHLLLAGWVCVTIMGAMTQFVPVWSGTAIHSERLAAAQLWGVGVGLAGFAGCLLTGAYAWLPAFGAVLLAGFWVFVYNLGRTLLGVRPWDVTERHFALALGFLVAVTGLGLALAVGYVRPVFADLPVVRGDVRAAHATLAVFGVVLTTVFGALYQLATMFTQSDLDRLDAPLRTVEEIGYPIGVVALAGGRLFGSSLAGRLGALLVVAGVVAMAVILGRRLRQRTVEWTPMLRRYGVAAAAMLLWAVPTARAWFLAPLDPAHTFGAPAGVNLLLFGVVGFVVAGTLYHVVPFIVWVHRYSDRLGFEAVPMIDDLYDARLARVDLVALVAGAAALTLAESGVFAARTVPWAGMGIETGTAAATLFGGVASGVGFAVFAANLVGVVR
ncbi:hypothetical protein [Halobellus sp. EA9]|uniref:hypothetical protein n=1 Tax=Halobellus sp. EA9 TaxID=3421647 RepID=UPI003EBED6C8